MPDRLRRHCLLAWLALFAPAAAARAQDPLGTEVTATFTDVRWQPRKLSDLGESRAIVLFFTSVDCPIVQRYLPRLQDFAAEYSGKGVRFLAVNAEAGDSLTDAAGQVVEHAPALVSVKDFDGSLARACGVGRTGAAVVLDGARKLVYRGRVDGQYRYSGAVPERGREDLRCALDDVLASRALATPVTEWEGCMLTPAAPATANAATFCRDVMPIVQRQCQDCHRPGGEGPFALMTFRDVHKRAAMVAEVVQQQRMPPWYGSSRYGTFSNHRGLSDQERSTLLGWIAAGAPEGDARELPQPRTFPDTQWRIGQPDLAVKVPVPIRIPADGYVPYKYFVLPYRFEQDTWVEAVEIKPSNKRALHHCNLVRVKFGEKFSQDGFITGQVPGGDAMVLDAGTALRIPAGSALALQAHYVTTGQPEEDRLQVGLRFPRVPVQKELRVQIVADFRFAIPPGANAWPVKATRKFDVDALGIGMFVHMHLRGRDMTVRLLPPAGGAETLLQVPAYNFDWQQSYRWSPQLKPFAAGTRVEALAHFDNSTFNAFNPDPAKTVKFGQETVDEMMYAFLFWVAEQEHLDLKVDPATGRAL
jgi:thiol-disulfide isomerase/thioredoxin